MILVLAITQGIVVMLPACALIVLMTTVKGVCFSKVCQLLGIWS
uniref:Uncharacterized protein n=1 Tax=Arundo donax TaxID=35708 RepID=A0A0A8YX70_ARUDO